MKVAAVTEKAFQAQVLALARLSGWPEIEEVLKRERGPSV